MQQYNGLGGRSKLDVFPQPLSQAARHQALLSKPALVKKKSLVSSSSSNSSSLAMARKLQTRDINKYFMLDTP